MPPPASSTTTTNDTTVPRQTPLLTGTDCTGQVHLVIGNNALASSRCAKLLESGVKIKLIAPSFSGDAGLYHGLQRRVEDGEIEHVPREFVKEDLTTLGREEVDYVVDRVFVTLPVDCAQCTYISALCRRLRIPVNVVDSPSLSTFSLLSSHTDGPLQIAVTTSGNGCKLANRIRREIVAGLPVGIGKTCDQIGRLRRRLWSHDGKDDDRALREFRAGEEDESQEQKSTFNALVTPEDSEAAKMRRIRWLSQISEYWPLEKLCSLNDADIDSLFQDYVDSSSSNEPSTQHTDPTTPKTSSSPLSRPPTISLVGSGPGHPSLLTRAALSEINTADLILADKLVPSGVLSLIPRRTPIFIAKKFPGNADAAQAELLTKGLEALQSGQKVVRLKQGDPYIYGRGAEEFDFFREHGYTPIVVPGLSSGLCGPLFAAIPATHRGVADQVLLCTGTGRKGAMCEIPEWVKSRTTVFLMALHRLKDVVEAMRERGWPMECPCAVVERASCPDQRVVRTRLRDVVEAIDEVGSRPPGILVVGWACEVLEKGGKSWVVEEGFKDY